MYSLGIKNPPMVVVLILPQEVSFFYCPFLLDLCIWLSGPFCLNIKISIQPLKIISIIKFNSLLQQILKKFQV